MQWPTLHKLDSKGKVRIWMVDAYESSPNNVWTYRQRHGTLGGKIQETSTRVCEGKNIGKTNETSVQQQCELEAQALWNKKRDRDGYSEDIPTEKPLRPMLAKKYQDDGKHIKFPCMAQTKLNGLRCLATVLNKSVKLVSRKDSEWKALTHLEAELVLLGDRIYDGELYKHGPNFQKIVGAVKRDEPNELSARIEFHIYDIVDETLSFADRHAIIQEELSKHDFKFLKPVLTEKLVGPTLVEPKHDEYVANGYEGLMLRNINGLYKINGRSKDLQKFKKFEDDEFEIIGATEMIGGWEGCCTFKCITKAGHEFDVTPVGDLETRSKYWQDWNNGKIKPGDMLTVKYFGYTTTDKPVPYIPTGICVRCD